MDRMKVDVAEELKTIRATADLPDISSETSEDMVKLANDARDFLGYKPLHNKVMASGQRLANVLIQLGIEVLDPATIFAYQEKLGAPNSALRRLVEDTAVVVGDEEFDDEEDEADEDDEDDEDDEEPRSKWKRMEWGRTEISTYRKPIPVHVLDKAIHIKQALPTVEFFVEELRKTPDPFLIAVFQNEQYYVEVWEEPKYEGRASATTKSRKSKR